MRGRTNGVEFATVVRHSVFPAAAQLNTALAGRLKHCLHEARRTYSQSYCIDMDIVHQQYSSWRELSTGQMPIRGTSGQKCPKPKGNDLPHLLASTGPATLWTKPTPPPIVPIVGGGLRSCMHGVHVEAERGRRRGWRGRTAGGGRESETASQVAHSLSGDKGVQL